MRQSTIEMRQQVYERVDEWKEVVASDPYRLHYHLMPLVGLLNDPNGFVFYKGKYHLFYQWNPFRTEHGAKFWGHYISRDLVHWKAAPIALAPDQWYDKDGCYSGSAVVFENKLYVFYTGNVKDEAGNRETYQCLAISEDGIHFEKKGPVIDVPEGYTAHFRDPKVFYKNNLWYMVIGAQTEELQGEAVLYSSIDLKIWHFQGALAGSGFNGLDDFGYMWECPDLVELGDRDILLVCPQGLPAKGFQYNNIFQSGYFAGKLDYHSVAFKHDVFVELDRGFDFYAPQTTMDAEDRRLLFGWMGNAEEEDSRQPTVEYGWIHAMTLPRELDWKNGKLMQYPAAELKSLRQNEIQHDDAVIEQETEFSGISGQVFELELVMKDWQADSFLIMIGESTVSFNAVSNIFTFKRRGFKDDGSWEMRHCHVEKLHEVRIYKDTSSLEIFVNNGEEVFTSRVFDSPEADKIRFTAENGTVTATIRKWDLKKVMAY